MAAKGSSSVLTPSNDQDAIHRAAKKHRSSGTKSQMTTGMFSDNRQGQLGRRKIVAKQLWERKQRSILFRISQATLAADDPEFLALKPESLARKVATSILLEFVTVEPQNGLSRTKAAFEVAKKGLSSEEMTNTAGVNKGCYVARRALKAAYDQLQAGQTLEGVTQPRAAAE